MGSKVYIIALFKSKRFWVSFTTILIGSTGIVSPSIALKLGAISTVITKLIDINNEVVK